MITLFKFLFWLAVALAAKALQEPLNSRAHGEIRQTPAAKAR